MHVLISSGRFSRALDTKDGSARNGRARHTRSASPRSITASPISGVLMRLTAATGISRCSRSARLTHVKPAGGTLVAIVGIRASCQPMPVLTIDAPADSTSRPSASTCSNSWASGTRSRAESRYITRKSGPATSRTRRTTSTAKRRRASGEPPQRSVRWLVCATRNSLIR